MIAITSAGYYLTGYSETLEMSMKEMYLQCNQLAIVDLWGNLNVPCVLFRVGVPNSLASLELENAPLELRLINRCCARSRDASLGRPRPTLP